MRRVPSNVLRVGDNRIATSPGGGGAAISAGAQSVSTGTVAFANSNGITFGMSGSSQITASHNGLTTAMASNRGTDFIQATAAFAGTNASGTIASNGISVSVGNYLTTAANSTHSHGNPTLNLTNLSGTTASNSAGFTLSLSAGNYLTTARASNDAVGLNSALTAGPLAMTVNSAGLSLNAASAAGTTSGFTGGASISGSMTHNTAGLAVSLSHPAWLTTAMASNAATLSNIRVSGGTTSNLLSAITFGNGNGVSFGLNASTMTASVETSYAASNHSHGNPTLNLTNLSGTTASNSAGFTLSLSAAAPGGGGAINVSAGTTSGNLQTVQFNDANGISFGLNGSTVTASHNGLTTAANSTHSHGNPTLNLTNLSGTTASASNGFTLSLSAAAPGGGGGFSVNHVENLPRVSISNLTNMTATGITQRPMFIPFVVPGSLTHNVMNIEVSRATSGSNAFTMQAALYTMANSTQLSRLASLQAVFSNTATASISGIRLLQLSGWETAGTTLSPGQYVMMIYNSAANTASMNYSYRGGISAGPPGGVILPGTDQAQTATSYLSQAAGWVRFNGVYTTTTGSPPASVAASHIQGWTSARPIYFHMGRT